MLLLVVVSKRKRLPGIAHAKLSSDLFEFVSPCLASPASRGRSAEGDSSASPLFPFLP